MLGCAVLSAWTLCLGGSPLGDAQLAGMSCKCAAAECGLSTWTGVVASCGAMDAVC